jgi:hypothetical protein
MMDRSGWAFAFFVFGVTSQLAACSSCKKRPAPDTTPEASVDAAPAATASAAPDASAAATPEVEAGAAPVVAAAGSASGAKAAAGGPWAGTYRCLNHLTLAQNGSQVVGHSRVGDDDDTYTCTISGDVCSGSESRVHAPKGKPPKPGKTRKLTLKRDANGTIHYSAEGNAPITCPK